MMTGHGGHATATTIAHDAGVTMTRTAARATRGTTISPSKDIEVQYTHLELHVDRVEHFGSELDAVKLFQSTGMHRSAQETFWVLAFGPVLNIATMFELNRGMYAYVDLHIPSLISGVLLSGVERFWVAHNHPSLSLEASPGDIQATREIMDAANTVKLHFEDHLILVPNGDFASLASRGLMRPDPNSPYQQSTAPRVRG
jgi:DNA repair protein RadC